MYVYIHTHTHMYKCVCVYICIHIWKTLQVKFFQNRIWRSHNTSQYRKELLLLETTSLLGSGHSPNQTANLHSPQNHPNNEAREPPRWSKKKKTTHKSVLPGLYLTGKPQTSDAPKFVCWHTLNLTLRKNLSEEKQAISLEEVSKGPWEHLNLDSIKQVNKG